ncbi:MAG: GntR family transcriptional regulator [Eubacteriales bacterium]|nr:GntR family transcriptional regulator [Eubacteriales bacterium]
MSIDRTNKQPIYRQIYEILLSEIAGGLYRQTGMLPGEKALCQRFGVERNTVRKALQILADEGRVLRRRGVGTTILPGAAAQSGPARRSIMRIAQHDYLHSGDGEGFYIKLIHSFEKRLSELGCDLLFKSVGKDDTVADAIRRAAPVAVIFDSYNHSAYYHQALQFGIPCVSINHYTPLMTSVVSNNFDGAYQVVRRLAAAGHKKIAFILGKRSHQTCMERFSGVQSLYMARGLTLRDDDVLPGNWLFGSGVEAGDRIAALPAYQRPTAVFAFNDDMAYGCYSSLARHGIAVPGDISIVGFDKSGRYDDMFPALTTVDVNLDAMVDYACWFLTQSLDGQAPGACAKIQIEAQLCDNGTIATIHQNQEETP